MNDETIARQFLLKHGVFTGSRAWGVEQDDSDWDYILTQTQLNKLKSLLDDEGILRYTDGSGDGGEEQGSSIFFQNRDRLYNIIIPYSDEYDSWVFATHTCFGVDRALIEKKPTRVLFFKEMKDTYISHFRRTCIDDATKKFVEKMEADDLPF